MTLEAARSAAAPDASLARSERLRGDARLRAAIDDLANQLCVSVDGDFDFSVRSAIEDETLEKLSMLVNFVVDTARRGMGALREHNDKLAELDQAKTVFFSNASHELRTPLTLILGPLEDALASGAPLEGETLQLAHRNAVRLLKLVNALLDFSRIEAGRLQPRFETVDLALLTGEVAGVFRDAVQHAGLAFHVDCPPLPEPVRVDRDMWERVVLNLLSNAFKATFEGSIQVTLRAVGDDVVLEVADTGTGIAADELPKLFTRFHRVNAPRARSHEGFGIGLAMIQELVRLHGGTVSVETAVSRGSTFSVTIPRHRQGAAEEAVERPAPQRRKQVPEPLLLDSPHVAPARPAEQPRHAARVLLADDNADMRSYVARLLAPHWAVETCANGREALEHALRKPPDLVLADIMMPEMDGHALLRALRKEPATRHVPVIFLSARAGAEAVAEGLETGADDYLVKPFAARELLARVRTHLELSRLRLDNDSIQRIGALLNAQLDLQTIVQTLTDEAVRLCGAQFGAFFYNRIDQHGESYTLYALAGVPREAFQGFPLPRNTAVFGPTFRGEGIVRIDDVHKDPRYGLSGPYHGMPKGHLPVCSYLAVPVVSRTGVVLGGLFFGHAEPGVFSARVERLIAAVAAQAAVAIDNAQLYEREQAARSEAEAANRAKDEFLAMLGHELRNPLAPIVTALEVMSLRGESGTQPERAVIRRQVDHVVRLVDDLLDVSRVTRGKIDLALEPVEMADIVLKACEIASPILEDRRHHLEVEVPPSGLCVHADPVRLAQVVSNLLNNAAKFTPPGGRISIRAAMDGDSVELRVRDNGAGIEPASLTRIFELFEQGQQPLARSAGGLGIGLAIVRSLVELHGGTVQAFSDGPGRGSEFTLRLPAALGRPRAQPMVRVAAPIAATGQGLRVLVVDDNVDAARLLSDALTLLNHDPRVATDGPAALRMAAEFEPQVVLLDLGLPAMDGYEVARRLRTAPRGKDLRLVAVTGYGQDSDRDRTTQAGFDLHLVKPIDIRGLAPMLEAWRTTAA